MSEETKVNSEIPVAAVVDQNSTVITNHEIEVDEVDVEIRSAASVPKTKVNDVKMGENGERKSPMSLKVRADEEGISPEDRKKNVKKLAGAISHSLRSNGEVGVRCFGANAIAKACKALAISQNYIGVQKLQLSFAPAFITTKIEGNELTGIAFYTFATEKTQEINLTKVKTVLMVKADEKDVTSEVRKDRLHKLAGAITHALDENREVVARCFGASSISKCAKAIAVARSYIASHGGDLYGSSHFIVSNMNGNERTGIAFYCYSNAMPNE